VQLISWLLPIANQAARCICPIMSALRFFYGTTLGNREAAAEIPLPRKADPLPAILSQDEVKRLLTAVPDRQMRTLLTTVYAAGLRVSEVVGLQVPCNRDDRRIMAFAWRARAPGHPHRSVPGDPATVSWRRSAGVAAAGSRRRRPPARLQRP
jgi:site-specific recombinase XerD